MGKAMMGKRWGSALRAEQSRFSHQNGESLDDPGMDRGQLDYPNIQTGQTIQIYGRDFTYNSALFGLVIYNNIRNKNNPLAILLVTFLGW